MLLSAAIVCTTNLESVYHPLNMFGTIREDFSLLLEHGEVINENSIGEFQAAWDGLRIIVLTKQEQALM